VAHTGEGGGDGGGARGRRRRHRRSAVGEHRRSEDRVLGMNRASAAAINQ
jgi:hypothetical protein